MQIWDLDALRDPWIKLHLFGASHRSSGNLVGSEAFLADTRDTLEAALQDVFDEHDVDPWVLQTYTFDERDIEGMIARAAEQVAEHAQGSDYTAAYFDLLRAHYRGISQAGGLFDDETVTQTRWGGRRRRNYLILYKQHYLQLGTPDQFNAVCAKLASALRPIGYRQRRLSGWEFHNWLTRLFNPGTVALVSAGEGDPTSLAREKRLIRNLLRAGFRGDIGAGEGSGEGGQGNRRCDC